MSIQPIGGIPPSIGSIATGTTVNRELSETRVSETPRAAGPSGETAASTQQARAPESREILEDAVSRLREFVQPINDSIQFTLDEDTGRTVVKVIDLQTQEVLRQIPSEEALTIAKALDKLQGLLIQNKA